MENQTTEQTEQNVVYVTKQGVEYGGVWSPIGKVKKIEAHPKQEGRFLMTCICPACGVEDKTNFFGIRKQHGTVACHDCGARYFPVCIEPIIKIDGWKISKQFEHLVEHMPKTEDKTDEY